MARLKPLSSAERQQAERSLKLARLADNSPVGPHSQRMLVRVIKASTQPKSAQLKDPFQMMYQEGVALAPPLPPEKMLQLMEENAVHGSCVRVKSIDAAGRGWTWQDRNDKKQVDPKVIQDLDDHLEALTPGYTFSELLVQAAWEQEGIGWGAWEIVRDPGTDEISAIFPMPSQTLRATPKDGIYCQIRGGQRRYFTAFGTNRGLHRDSGEPLREGQDPELEAHEVLIFKTYSPRSLYYGVPSWVSIIPTLAELVAIREFNVSWFSSGGQTDRSVHIKANDVLVADQIAEKMEEQLKAFAGIGHTTVITSGTIDTEVNVQQLDIQNKEGHFRLRRGDLIKEVLMGHQVPPYRIGWAELGALGGGSGAAQEMLDAYRYGAIRPLQRILESRVNQTLFGPLGLNVPYKFKLLDLDIDELRAEIELIVRGVGSGVMTPNQGRLRLGLETDPDEHLNKYYMASNIVPIEKSGQKDPAFGGGPPAPGQEKPGGPPGPKPGSPPRKSPGQGRTVRKVVESLSELAERTLEGNPALTGQLRAALAQHALPGTPEGVEKGEDSPLTRALGALAMSLDTRPASRRKARP